jgi:hypothetical protein
MKKTVLLTFLFFAAISCQESPGESSGDNSTEDTISLFETTKVDIPDVDFEQLSTTTVDLDLDSTVVVLPDPFIQTTLWPVETETVSFEPQHTEDTVDDSTDSCECGCDCHNHCHGYGHCHHHGHGYGHHKCEN